jgi:hypothetical protein
MLEGFDNSEQGNDQYDQPPACRISWYADGSNGRTGINRTAARLNSPPTISLLDETHIPEFPSTMILPTLLLATLTATILLKIKRKPKSPFF